MPNRAGLSRDRVLAAAAELVDRRGASELSLTTLAKRFGVRTPSLYNHVDGLDGLRRDLRLRALEALADELRRAAVGRAGADALHAIAHAYRDYALAHPGLYALTQSAVPPAGEEEGVEVRDAERGVVEVVAHALRGYGLEGEEAVHAVRCLRSALHGFVTLETNGGFAMDLAPSESFARLVALLDHGLASAGSPRTEGRPQGDGGA